MSVLFLNKEQGNVNEAIINMLSKNWPLSAKELFVSLKKMGILVSYQAIFQAAKELTAQGILTKEGKVYALDVGWLNNLYEFAEAAKIRYSFKENTKKIGGKLITLDFNLQNFIVKVGPPIKEFIGNDQACLIAISSSGGYYASGMKRYLLKEEKNVSCIEVNRNGEKIHKNNVWKKKVVVIDSAIYSGQTYRRIMKKLSRLKTKYAIQDIRYAVNFDFPGLADWSSTRMIPHDDEGEFAIRMQNRRL